VAARLDLDLAVVTVAPQLLLRLGRLLANQRLELRAYDGAVDARGGEGVRCLRRRHADDVRHRLAAGGDREGAGPRARQRAGAREARAAGGRQERRHHQEDRAAHHFTPAPTSQLGCSEPLGQVAMTSVPSSGFLPSTDENFTLGLSSEANSFADLEVAPRLVDADDAHLVADRLVFDRAVGQDARDAVGPVARDALVHLHDESLEGDDDEVALDPGRRHDATRAAGDGSGRGHGRNILLCVLGQNTRQQSVVRRADPKLTREASTIRRGRGFTSGASIIHPYPARQVSCSAVAQSAVPNSLLASGAPRHRYSIDLFLPGP
jgi:hypothetical protein